MRWPCAIVAGSVQCVGCTVLATDVSNGIVTVIKADGGGSIGSARLSIQSTFLNEVADQIGDSTTESDIGEKHSNGMIGDDKTIFDSTK